MAASPVFLREAGRATSDHSPISPKNADIPAIGLINDGLGRVHARQFRQ